MVGRNKTTWEPAWHHGKTKTIRVPIALASEIIEYARAIDRSSSYVFDADNIPKRDGDVFFQQLAVLEALVSYVQWKRKNYHPNQNARSLDTNTRAWDEFRKFQKMVKEQPELLLFPK